MNDPYLARFAQADTIVPGGVQGYDRYAYVNNNPVRYNDPSGHYDECSVALEGCVKSKTSPGLNSRKADKNSEQEELSDVIWSTAKYKNEELGKFLANLSTRLQHTANFFSYLGAISEVGFTTAGLLGGGAAVGWIDLGFPVADVSGGLAGGLVGWEVGHGIHTLVTNPLESSVSTSSTIATYLSDIAYGNTRIDIYESNVTAVVGQPTATSVVLTFVGNANTVGMVDAAIDQVGSWYADGKIGGVYNFFGITGESFYFSTEAPYLSIQFGDK